MTEKMPSSTRLGSRPSAFRIRSYSSGLSPCSATSSGVMRGASRTSIPARLASRIRFVESRNKCIDVHCSFHIVGERAMGAKPDGYHTVTPYLAVKDAAKALDFYTRALGATEVMRFEHGGRI